MGQQMLDLMERSVVFACFFFLACMTQFTLGRAEANEDSLESTDEENMQSVFEMNFSPARIEGGIAPIIPSLQRGFDECARQVTGHADSRSPCAFENLGVLPTKSHCKTDSLSCHALGRAVDIGSIRCGNSRIEPSRHRKQYNDFVKCLMLEVNYGDLQQIELVIYAHASEHLQNIIKSQVREGELLKGESEAVHLHLQLKCSKPSEPPRHVCSGSQ
jgi:hypothetical protein